jgi:PAS domain S-box-containing protein
LREQLIDESGPQPITVAASEGTAPSAIDGEWAVIVTDADGAITEWNRAATEIYGWSCAEVIGRSAADVLVPEFLRTTADVIMSQLAGGESWSGQFAVRRRDGCAVLADVTDIPVLSDGKVTAIVGTSRVIAPGRTPPTVLIVDDDPSIAGLLREVLLEEGYAVRTAASASEALAFAQLERVDLVIFDYRMDGMDGTEFYRQLRTLGVSAPAVMCSAWRDGPAVADQLGVTFVAKPFDLDDMIDVLKRVSGPA